MSITITTQGCPCTPTEVSAEYAADLWAAFSGPNARQRWNHADTRDEIVVLMQLMLHGY